MKKSTKNPDGGGVGRFFAGFLIAGTIAFFATLFSSRGRDVGADFGAACVVAPIAGFAVGVLSAFGKRILQFFIAFFTQMPL